VLFLLRVEEVVSRTGLLPAAERVPTIDGRFTASVLDLEVLVARATDIAAFFKNRSRRSQIHVALDVIAGIRAFARAPEISSDDLGAVGSFNLQMKCFEACTTTVAGQCPSVAISPAGLVIPGIRLVAMSVCLATLVVGVYVIGCHFAVCEEHDRND